MNHGGWWLKRGRRSRKGAKMKKRATMDNEAKARAGRVGAAMESCTPWEVVMLVR